MTMDFELFGYPYNKYPLYEFHHLPIGCYILLFINIQYIDDSKAYASMLYLCSVIVNFDVFAKAARSGEKLVSQFKFER